MKQSKSQSKRELVFSKSFLDFLEEIKKQSAIARIIISCLTLKKNNLGHIADYVLTGDEVSYITYRNNGKISFIVSSKEQLFNDDGTWKTEGRQEGKPSKIIRKVFSKNILKLLKETDFEIFNNKYKAKFVDEGYRFKVEPAKNIPNIYCYDYQSEEGSIGGSCMKGDADLVSFYKDVPGLRIVTMYNTKQFNSDNEPLLVGRALLWKARRQSDGIEIDYLDRAYVQQDFMYQSFSAYAIENGWWAKAHLDTREYREEIVNPLTEESEEHYLYVPIEDMDEHKGPFPYIDSFAWGKDDRLMNYEPTGRGNRYLYQDTSGRREIWDRVSGEWVSEEETEEVCMGSREGEQVASHLLVYSERHEGYILRDEAYDVDGEYYHESYVRRVA